MKKCLLLVDLQNDYFPGGKMELVGMEEAAGNARMLLDQFRNKNMPVVHIQHISHGPNAFFFLPGTEGAKINGRLAPLEGESIVVKNYPNSFRQTSLQGILTDWPADQLILCGAMSHMCIDATTRAAFDLGFSCTVAEDACATMDLYFHGRLIHSSDVHASFMAALAYPYARVISTEEMIKEIS